MAARSLSTRSSVSPSTSKPPCRDGLIQRRWRLRRYGKLAAVDWERAVSTVDLVHLRRGDLRKAEEALRQHPEGEEWGAGGWQLAVERGDKGLDARLDALAARPSRYTGRGQRPPLRALLGTRGRASLRAGRIEEGLDFLKQALAQRPPRWDIETWEGALADAYRNLGRLDDAEKEYARLLRLNARMPGALYGLGIVREKQGRREDARRFYEGFLEVWKTADDDALERRDAQKRLAALNEAN
jgi:tetratricopeptide (TPR) repeat protein